MTVIPRHGTWISTPLGTVPDVLRMTRETLVKMIRANFRKACAAHEL